MKRYIRSNSTVYNFKPGDKVTVYNGTFGYSNFDAEFVTTFKNKYGVTMATVRTKWEDEDVPLDSIIPSQRNYLNSLTLDEILTKDFVKKMVFKDDSLWCKKQYGSRVDRNTSIENNIGADADIISYVSRGKGYRVCITDYISKHGSITKEYTDETQLSIDDPMIDEALDILRYANEVVLNFAGYQRIFKR